jgi:transposase
MTRKQRRFTRDFKITVISELDSGKCLSEVAKEYEIHPSQICRWKREFSKNPKEAFSGQGNIYKTEAKIARLERLVGQLYAENEFLKKALKTLEINHQEEKKKTKQR